MSVRGRTVQVPANPYVTEWDDERFRCVPRVGEHDALPIEEMAFARDEIQPASARAA
jgi:itaconate CoA-transferase